MRIITRPQTKDLMNEGLLEIGEGSIIDEDVWFCHWLKDGAILPVKVGKNCKIRSGSVIYGDCVIGDNCNFGHHVVLREGCRVGDNTSIGTGVKVENNARIGSFVSIETQSHVTGGITIEDYVFFGANVVTNNDFGMRYRRDGHGEFLNAPTIKKGARIGSNATVMAGVLIGEHSMVNSGEVVRKNIPPGVLMFTAKNSVIYKKIRPDLKEGLSW
jgi:acetyltransferase-like isoleucine patch superfamily enzyme